MTYLVSYQQHKYSDNSDNPALRTWRIKADTPDEAFETAQRRAVEARQDRRYLTVKRTMQTEAGEIVTADTDYLPAYMECCI